MDVMIIKLGAIGDVIRTTSILPGLKSRYKGCSIDWITKKNAFDVLKNNKFIDKIYTIEGKLKLKDSYDLIISLDDESQACELASKILTKKIIGAHIKDGQKVYTNDSALWFDMGLISRFGKMKADKLKAKNTKTYQSIIYQILGLNYQKQEPVLNLDESSLKFARTFMKTNGLGENDFVIGVNTGAGGRWEDKKLSTQETAQLIDSLKQIKNAKIILFGGPEEKERNQKIKMMAKAKIIDAGCDNSLMEFSSLVNLCKILVTSDSLALHIGTALKKKIVVFFGPTSSAEIDLYSRGIKIIPKKGCLCCYKPKCDIPPDYNVDEIVSAVKKLLK